MGWWGSYYGYRAPKGKERLQAVLRSEKLDQETEHGKLIDAALVGTTVYGAYYNKKLDFTYGIVLLSRFDDGYLMIKSLDETCCPCESHCPKRILMKLSPLTPEHDPSGNAAAWRERCNQNLSGGDELSCLPMGTKIQLHNPSKTVLTVEKNYKGRRCYRGFGCRASARCIKSWGYDVLGVTSKG